MSSSIVPLLYIAPLCLGLAFLIRRLARLENRLMDREGAEVAFFEGPDDTWAQSLVLALDNQGITGRVRRKLHGVGVFVDSRDESAAHEVWRAWDASRDRSEEEGAV